MKRAIIYYSLSDNTKDLAKKLKNMRRSVARADKSNEAFSNNHEKLDEFMEGI